MKKLKEILINLWFLLLASVVVLLKAVAWLAMIPFVLCVHLYKKIRYEAQCLRNQPPPGGVFGAMARSQTEKSRGSNANQKSN